MDMTDDSIIDAIRVVQGRVGEFFVLVREDWREPGLLTAHWRVDSFWRTEEEAVSRWSFLKHR